MSFWSTHPKARWLAPVAAVAAIAVTPYAVSASADSGLPTRSAAQLLADVHQSDVATLSGTIVESANLGLPSVPGLGGQSGSSDLTSLVSGSHTLRVWLDGPDKQRLAVVGSRGESDIIRNGTTLWTWSSATKTATKRTINADEKNLPTSAASALPSTPQDAAAEALKAIDPSTTVTTSGTATVAGRAAYELVLTPKTKTTRVAQVRIAIDGVKHVPLRVQVYSTRLAKPAFEVGFTSVDFGKPDARQFAFSPATGTTVKNGDTPASTAPKTPALPDTKAAAAKPTIVGTGWSTVVVATLPADALAGLAGASGTSATAPTDKATVQSTNQIQGILKLLPKVSGAWGSGHLLSGTLFSAVLTDDGRVAIGAVPPEQLYAALAAK